MKRIIINTEPEKKYSSSVSFYEKNSQTFIKKSWFDNSEYLIFIAKDGRLSFRQLVEISRILKESYEVEFILDFVFMKNLELFIQCYFLCEDKKVYISCSLDNKDIFFMFKSFKSKFGDADLLFDYVRGNNQIGNISVGFEADSNILQLYVTKEPTPLIWVFEYEGQPVSFMRQDFSYGHLNQIKLEIENGEIISIKKEIDFSEDYEFLKLNIEENTYYNNPVECFYSKDIDIDGLWALNGYKNIFYLGDEDDILSHLNFSTLGYLLLGEIKLVTPQSQKKNLLSLTLYNEDENSKTLLIYRNSEGEIIDEISTILNKFHSKIPKNILKELEGNLYFELWEEDDNIYLQYREESKGEKIKKKLFCKQKNNGETTWTLEIEKKKIIYGRNIELPF